MPRSPGKVTFKQRNEFKAIIHQLDKTSAPTKVVKIIEQAHRWLTDHDVAWDAVSLFVPVDYQYLSDRKKKHTPTLSPKAAVQAAGALTNGSSMGYDGRALLKRAISNHADWPAVRETLGINIAMASTVDLIAVGQLLNLKEEFLKLFINVPSPTQQELPLNGSGHTDE